MLFTIKFNRLYFIKTFPFLRFLNIFNDIIDEISFEFADSYGSFRFWLFLF